MNVTLSNGTKTDTDALMLARTNRILIVQLPSKKKALFHEGRGFISENAKKEFTNGVISSNPATQYDSYDEVFAARQRLLRTFN